MSFHTPCTCLRPDVLGATTIEPVMDVQAMEDTVLDETVEVLSAEVCILPNLVAK